MRISSNMLPQRAAYFSDGPTHATTALGLPHGQGGQCVHSWKLATGYCWWGSVRLHRLGGPGRVPSTCG